MADTQRMETRDFREKMTSFPCMFNMPCFDHPVRYRLRERKDSLSITIDNGVEDKEEELKLRNSLTWIFYQLGLYENARGMNELVLMETKNENLVAIGNSVYLEWLRSGTISDHFKLLEDFQKNPDFNERVLAAKGEQAYCLGKLGNMYNLMSAIEVYEKILASKECDDWRYYLALAYRRLSVMCGLEKYSNHQLTSSKCQERAEECFRRVAESSNKRLKAIAIVNLAANFTSSDSLKERGIERAVLTDYNSEVCLIGGKALLYSNLIRAISLLKNGVELRSKHSGMQHQLGKAYIRQGRGKEGEAHRYLRMSYETSGKENYYPILDLARSFKKMRDGANAQRESMTVLTSRSAAQDVGGVASSHVLLFELTRAQRHLVLSMLSHIAQVNVECTAEERYALWSGIFELDQRHAAVKLPGSAKRFKEYVWDRHQRDIHVVCQAVEKCLRDGRIDDPEALVSETRSILRKHTNEEALLFIELVSLRPRMDTSKFLEVKQQLLKYQASNCLSEKLGTSVQFFRQLFDLSFLSREELATEDPESGFDVSIKIDIVVLFNDSIDNFSNLCANTAYGLEDAMSTFFRVKVAFNPNVDVGEDGDQSSSLLHFVNKHKIDVVLVVFEGDGAETDYLMEKVSPFLEASQNDRPSPSVVLVQCNDQPALYLPGAMKQLPCLTLGKAGDDFPNLFCRKEIQERADQSIDINGVLQAYFQGDTRNVMKLFDHLIRQDKE